jgi:hypothetical protein
MSSKISLKHKFPIDGLKWIPYVIGWIFGFFQLFFWILQFIVALFSEDKHKFIDKTFHDVVYYYGVVCIGVILLVIIIWAFYLALLV